MTDLIVRCLDDDPEAWHCLWKIVTASIHRPPVRGRDCGLLDDAEQEFYLFLRDDDWRRLRNFRGEGDRAVRSYLRILVGHFLISYRLAHRRAEIREQGVRLAVARPEVAGPTEPQLLAVFREFTARASPEDHRRLGALLGSDEDPVVRQLGPRTLRRWRSALEASYRQWLL